MTSFLKKKNIQNIDENGVFILNLSKKKNEIYLSLNFLQNISYKLITC